MVASAMLAYLGTANLAAQQSSVKNAGEEGGKPARKDPSGEKNPAAIVDLVTLSSAAKAAASAKTDPAIAYYAQFFPGRDGPATALGTAIVDPGAESISKGKSIGEVAVAARASMDAKYAEMEKSGQPFDINSWEGKDWYTLMGDLDRRALHAVSSNQGGLFSKQEQDMAQSIMVQQQGWAMGLGGGPTRLVEGVPDRFASDHAARFKAAVQWLDGVSNDEKTSVAWAMNRASAQTSYEWTMAGRGEPAENLDSESPLVKLIKAALATMKDNHERGWTTGRITNADELKAQPWFKGFEDQLAAAMQATQEFYFAAS